MQPRSVLGLLSMGSVVLAALLSMFLFVALFSTSIEVIYARPADRNFVLGVGTLIPVFAFGGLLFLFLSFGRKERLRYVALVVDLFGWLGVCLFYVVSSMHSYIQLLKMVQ